MSTPLVTIVIPCFNAESWIAESVGSAVAQTWPNKEIIVIDDGSTDRSLTIIKGFGDRIRWESGANRGGGAARNRGISMARGEWIQFLDSDDVLEPRCVQQKLAANPGPGELACCGVCNLADGSQLGLPKSWFRGEFALASMLAEGTPTTSAPLIQRESLLAVGGFREELKCAQEFDLFLRLSIISGMTFVPNGHLGVRIRPTPGSVCRAAGIRMPLTTADVLSNCARLLQEKNELTSEYREIIGQRLIRLAREVFRMGQPAAAIEIAKKARLLTPRWYRNSYKSQLAAVIPRMCGFAIYERLHTFWRKTSGR